MHRESKENANGASVHPIVLLPCPFCGGKAEKIHLQHMGIEGYRIYCVRCYITTETMANSDSVVDRWNSRRTDGMIAWLDAEIEKCDESRVSGLSIRRGALIQCKKQLLKLLDGMGVSMQRKMRLVKNDCTICKGGGKLAED